MENHFNCIYCYTNKINGKKCVGQAVDFIKRHKQHINQAYNENCIAYNQYFHRAIRRHRIENFEIEILIENLQNQEELNYWECYYIVEFDTLAKNGKGYNLASGGYGNTIAGKTDEELAEIRRKSSETNKKTWNNKSEEEIKEFGRKISEAYHNKTDEELAEIRKKQSEANKGEKHPRVRKIVLVDVLTKQIVFIWQYQKQATEFYGISKGTLNYYLKGKAKSGREYNGFLWYYLDEYEQLTN